MGVREVIFPELKSGVPLEAYITAVSWCDGDISQINAIIKLKNIEFNEKIIWGPNIYQVR